MSNELSRLKTELEKIDFSLEYCGANHMKIMNHKKEFTGFLLFDNTIEFKGEECSVFFGLKDVRYRWIKDTLTITEDKEPKEAHIFIQFYNFDKKEEMSVKEEKK